MQFTALGLTKPVTKMLLVMKMTALLLTVFSFAAFAKTEAQITLKEKNAPLEKVLKLIKKQSSYSIFFNETLVKEKGKPVDVVLNNASVEDALNTVFRDQLLTYQIAGKIITIQEKENKVQQNNSGAVGVAPIANPDVTIVVTNADGQPLEGASVTIKGQNKGVATDINGRAVLKNVDPNATFVIAFTGFQNQEIKLNSRSSIGVRLQASTSVLDEVQMIAYGQTSKRLSTGNISTIKGEEIEKQPISNPLQAIQGRVPGVFITSSTGITGGAIKVRIQGQNSINSGNDPLYVIDGVPYATQLPRTGVGGTSLGSSNGGLGDGSPLFYVNPSDIESIDILKDADATSIYGSRAANGAILITTKSGRPGKTKMEINWQKGFSTVPHFIEMMNTRQYLDMRYEAYRNDNIDWKQPSIVANDLKIWDTTRYTDWQKELLGGTAQFNNINGSISGGNASLQYLIGGTFHRETTVFPGSLNDQKESVHFNVKNTSNNQKFRFHLSGNYVIDNNQLPYGNVTQSAVLLAPDAPALYNSDGTINWGFNSSGATTWSNPLVPVLNKTYTNKSNNLIGSASLSYEVLKGLNIKSSFGYTIMQTSEFVPTSFASIRPDRQATTLRESYFGTRNMNSWSIEPQATYRSKIFTGFLEALVGASFQKNASNTMFLDATGFNSDLVMLDVKSAANVRVVSSSSLVYKYSAFWGKINYDLGNKFIFNLTARRDGSSRFGDNSKFHNFASLGAAWIFSEDKMFKGNGSFLSFGKISASYGTTGNDQIADYAYLSLYGATSAGVPYQGTTGLSSLQITNPYIQWEETQKLHFGVDLGFLDDRILLNTSYSRNRSSNQILPYVLPTITGFSGIGFYNFPATVQNSSWEISVNTNNIKSRLFKWNSNFNLTIPHNKITSFPNIDKTTYASGNSGIVIGQPIGVVQIFHYSGVDPATGLYTVNVPSTGMPTSNPNYSKDYSDLISTLPKFYGGVQNSFTYKDFQLDFLFIFVKQIGLDNWSYYNESATPGLANSNQPTSVLNRWQKSGDNVAIQKYSSNGLGVLALSSNAGYSDAASYIRLKNLSLSWQLPIKWQQKAHFQNARVYVHAQNLLTFTKFKGIDPEIQSLSSTLPPLRTIVIGMQLGF